MYHKYGIGIAQRFLIENLTKKMWKSRHGRKKKISRHRKQAGCRRNGGGSKKKKRERERDVYSENESTRIIEK